MKQHMEYEPNYPFLLMATVLFLTSMSQSLSLYQFKPLKSHKLKHHSCNVG